MAPVPANGPPAGQQVQTFGGTSFGVALNDTKTPTGQTYGSFPSVWPFTAGAAGWFGQALGDGVSYAFGSMTLTDSEAKPTMLGTTLFIWNTVTNRLQAIPVPTDQGIYNPPFPNGASGSTIDMIRAVTIAGVNYVFAVNAVGYAGWQIAQYGKPYHLMAFKQTGNEWAFDPTHSYTCQQLNASSAAGAAAFPSSVNSFSETVYVGNGPVCMQLMPVSGHLLWGNYFYAAGTNSGSIVACNPATGVVTCFYQYPDITDIYGVPVTLSVRDLAANPASLVNDERMIMTPDVFVKATGLNYHQSPLMEMQYNAGAATIVPVSTPNIPYSMPNMGWANDFNLAQYDPSGNLWLPTSGGPGIGVFHGRELHYFAVSSHHVPTFDNGGPAANWYAGAAGQFPTTIQGDFRFGCFAIPQGFNESLNWDPTRSNMVMLGIGATVVGGKVQTPTTLGTEKAVNGGITSGTTGWNGFFTSSLLQVTDAGFTSGKALQLTSIAGIDNIGSQANVAVTVNQCYQLLLNVKGPVVPQLVQVEIWWHNAGGGLVSVSSSSFTEPLGGVVYHAELLTSCPPGATQAFILIEINASSPGENHLIGDVSWKSVPCLGTAVVDTNRGRLSSGAPGIVTPNKGDILGGRLFFSHFGGSNLVYPADVGQFVPQWLVSLDLSTVV